MRRKPKLIIVASFMFASLVISPITYASNEYYYSLNSILYYDNKSGCDEVGEVSAELSKNIPSNWGAVFSAAAEKFDVNPNFLAALYLTENGNVWKPFDTAWASSPVGASGPMQFMPGTWAGHAQDGNDDGQSDIMNVHDAVFAAAHLVKSFGTDKNTPLGDINRPWKRGSITLLYAAGAYNWGSGHVEQGTSDSSPLEDAPTETENYLSNINTLFESDFTKSGHPQYQDPVATGEGGSGGSSVSAEDCKDDSGVVAGDIVKTAVGFVNKETVSVPSEAYTKARQRYNPEAGGDMTDCGMFVATVMRASGADPEYPSYGTSNQLKYLKNSSKYTIVNTKSPSTLQAGDILVNNGHTMLYLGDQGDGIVAVEASLGDHPPKLVGISRVQTQLNFSDNIVARLK